MPSRHASLEIFLQPGEHYAGGGDTRIRTLLGSCVSITLWHEATRIGAMSHYLLGERIRRAVEAPLDARYGNEAMMLMMRDLTALGVPVAECVAKVFGGADMFHGRAAGGGVGRRNVAAAEELLGRYRIPIVSSSVYGRGHRFLIFDVATGDVWSRLSVAAAAPQTAAAAAGARR